MSDFGWSLKLYPYMLWNDLRRVRLILSVMYAMPWRWNEVVGGTFQSKGRMN